MKSKGLLTKLASVAVGLIVLGTVVLSLGIPAILAAGGPNPYDHDPEDTSGIEGTLLYGLSVTSFISGVSILSTVKSIKEKTGLGK